MQKIEEIIEFIKSKSCVDEVNIDSDIFKDLSMYGDDFHELIEEFSINYSVDMSKYLWYFHADEEGQNIGGVFFDPPYKMVKRIPVTPTMLSDFATKGVWYINYPEHSIPKKRYDLLINKIILIVFVIYVIYWCVNKVLS